MDSLNIEGEFIRIALTCCYNQVIRQHLAFEQCFVEAILSFYTESFLSFVAQIDSKLLL